jgi:hypothetical protein
MSQPDKTKEEQVEELISKFEAMHRDTSRMVTDLSLISALVEEVDDFLHELFVDAVDRQDKPIMAKILAKRAHISHIIKTL